MTLVLFATACSDRDVTSASDDVGGDTDVDMATETSSDGGVGSTSDAGVSTVDASTSSEDGPASGSAEDDPREDSDEGSDTEGPGSPCSDGMIELEGVVVEVATNRVLGDDAPVEYDAESFACLYADDGAVSLRVTIGPSDRWGPRSHVKLTIYDGARAYDLATDAAPPNSGEDGSIDLSYTYAIDRSSTVVFETAHHVGTGTVSVVEIGTGDTNVDVTFTGELGAPDGWEFDLHVTGVVPVE
jgi:hypothetical protein